MPATRTQPGSRSGDPPVTARRSALAGVCLLAAVAPVNPGVVLLHGAWVAAAVLVLRWRHFRPGAPELAGVALAAWVTADALGTYRVMQVQVTVRDYWTVVAVAAAARVAVTGRRAALAVGCAYVAGCLYAATGLARSGAARDGAVRVALAGVNVNYTAYALATGAVVAVVCAAGVTSRTGKLALLASAAATAAAVTLTGTRGAVTGVILAAGYLALSRVAPRLSFALAVPVGVALLVAVPLGLYGDQRLLWIQGYFQRQDATIAGRLDVWPLAREAWSAAPWTGVGPGLFPLSNPLGIGAHSLVLTLGVELGVVGAVLFLVAVGSLLAAPTRCPAGRRLVGLLLACWLPIWLSGHWELSPAAWIVLGLWSRLPSGQLHPDPVLDTDDRPGRERGGQVRLGQQPSLDGR